MEEKYTGLESEMIKPFLCKLTLKQCLWILKMYENILNLPFFLFKAEKQTSDILNNTKS